MGGGKYSLRVTRKEEHLAKYTINKPPFNGILTVEMVNFELTNNVNNVGANKYASADEVAKLVAEKLRDHYNNDGFKASGRNVVLGDKKITIKKSSEGGWAAKDR